MKEENWKTHSEGICKGDKLSICYSIIGSCQSSTVFISILQWNVQLSYVSGVCWYPSNLRQLWSVCVGHLDAILALLAVCTSCFPFVLSSKSVWLILLNIHHGSHLTKNSNLNLPLCTCVWFASSYLFATSITRCHSIPVRPVSLPTSTSASCVASFQFPFSIPLPWKQYPIMFGVLEWLFVIES